jgi:hypothetical protein
LTNFSELTLVSEVSSVGRRKRQRILERALSLPLPDAAFEIVHYNDFSRQMGPRPHRQPIPLKALVAKGSLQQIEQWATRVASLRVAASAVTHARPARDASYELAKANFKTAHPGFSDETYDKVIGYGY